MESKHEQFLAIDHHNAIVANLAKGANAIFVNGRNDLKNYPNEQPVIFRGMTGKIAQTCEQQMRDYYYIDTGYLGNLTKHKRWHRVVKNGMQHSHPRYDLPDDRFNELVKTANYDHIRFNGWKPEGSNILLVTPSEKPCKFYNVDRNKWVADTIAELESHTDRTIIIRDKPDLRSGRIREHSIFKQFAEDDIYAVVTYNSIAATEAIGYGIPAYTVAPNIADSMCHKDLSMIESPKIIDEEEVIKWQNWIAYCQYTYQEMISGSALAMIKEYDLK